jgi:hypothetical protein
MRSFSKHLSLLASQDAAASVPLNPRGGSPMISRPYRL